MALELKVMEAKRQAITVLTRGTMGLRHEFVKIHSYNVVGGGNIHRVTVDT